MRVIGHRGAAAVAPENTVSGVARAFADGADQVEVDVRLTADGHPVIIHDETLDRIVGIPGRIDQMDLAGIRAAVRGEQAVPTLSEIWDAASGRVVLELKGAWGSGRASAAAAAVAAFLDGKDVSDTVVSSFDLIALDAFRAAGGTAPTGVLTVEAIDPAANLDAAIQGNHAVCYIPGTVVTEEVVRIAHRAGKQVIAWTVNDPAAIRALVAARADGVISDDPAAARAALAADET